MERTEIHKILDMVLDIGTSSKHSVKVSYTGSYYSDLMQEDIEPYVDIVVFEYNGNSEKVKIKAQLNFVREFNKDVQAFLLAWKEIIMRERVEHDFNRH
jgi:hypothetical protein